MDDVRVGAVTDDRRLRALFDEHAASVLGYAMRLTGGDRMRAEDVVQETLLRAWRNPPAVDGGQQSLRPWLFTVARNVAIDAHRARRARPTEVADEALALMPATDDVERALETWLVADALAALSPEHRAVLVETYYRGRSVGETAAVLGVPPGTVKSRTHYALRSLRAALLERGVTP